MCLANELYSDELNTLAENMTLELARIVHSEEPVTKEELNNLRNICRIYKKPLILIKDNSIKKTAEEILSKYFAGIPSWERNQYLRENLEVKN